MTNQCAVPDLWDGGPEARAEGGEESVIMFRAGASLVQVTTALMIRGPACATNIRRELAEALVTR